MLTFLPRKGLTALVGLRRIGAKKIPYLQWVDTTGPDAQENLEDKITYLREYRQCADIYASIASFRFRDGEDKLRTADKAVSLKSYLLDVDCNGLDPDKSEEWDSPEEALRHILPTLDRIGLPPSSIIFSGTGLQFLWTFTTEVKPDAWLDIADQMWSLSEHFGFRGDSARRRDRNTMFRVPGTTNSKSGRTARVIFEDEPYRPDDFLDFLDQIAKEYGVRPAIILTRDSADSLSDDDEGTVESHPQNVERLKYLLKRIPPHLKTETGRSGSIRRSGYEQWRSVIWGVKRTGLPGARALAYHWAMGAESKYDDLEESFDRTWDSDVLEKDHTTGPGTLVYLARRHAPKRDQNDLGHFHFLDTDELRALDGVQERETSADPEFYSDPWGFLVTVEDDEGIEADERAAERDAAFYARHGRWPEYTPDPEDGDADFSCFGDDGSYRDDADGDEGGPETLEDDPEDEEDDYLGPIHLAPPGRYGGPKGELPPGFLANPAGPGFGTLVKVAGEEGENITEFKLLCSCHLELVESNLATSSDGFNERYSYVFRKYNERTGRPESPFHVKGSELTESAALMRILGDAGLLLMMNKDTGQKMSRYMQALIRKRREEKKEVPIIQQAGWFRDNTAFALGEAIITPTGKPVLARVDPAIGASLRGLGQTKGTLEGQKQLIAPFGTPGCEQQAALLALFLGSPLARFAPNPGGVVWVHTPSSGVGKTHVFNTANSLFGNHRGLFVNGKGTLPYFSFTQVSRNDIPTYIDELDVGTGPNDRQFQQMKSFLLHATQGVDRGKMRQGGVQAAAGDKEWNAPLFITTNAPFDYVVTDSGPSTEGAYARGLVVPFQTKRLYPTPVVDGVDWTVGIGEHYGHIGQAFISYIVQNQEELRVKANTIYRDLQHKSALKGMDKLHRFHNSTIACGMIALEWMDANGMIDSWDVKALMEYLPGMAHATDEAVQTISSNDPQSVWTDFLIQYQTNIVRQGNPGTNVRVPDDLPRNRMGVVIRLSGGTAFVKSTVFKRYCSQRGVSTDMVLRWLRDKYFCSDKTAPCEMAADTDMPRQSALAYSMHRTAVEHAVERQKEGHNVVNIGLRK